MKYNNGRLCDIFRRKHKVHILLKYICINCRVDNLTWNHFVRRYTWRRNLLLIGKKSWWDDQSKRGLTCMIVTRSPVKTISWLHRIGFQIVVGYRLQLVYMKVFFCNLFHPCYRALMFMTLPWREGFFSKHTRAASDNPSKHGIFILKV